MTSTRLPALAVLVVLACGAAAPARAATSVALLPMEGEAPRPTRKWMDAALRDAVETLDGVTLQPAEETSGHIASLEDLGMVCRRDDVQCLVKLGIVAGVDGLLLPALDGDAAAVEIAVSLDYIDVAAARRVRTGSGTLVEGDDEGALVIVRAAVMPGASEGGGTSSKPPEVKAPPPPSSEPVPWGVIALGTGAVVTAVALPSAVISELLYAGSIPGADAETRRDIVQPLGLSMWIATAVGLTVLGVGGASLILEHDASP